MYERAKADSALRFRLSGYFSTLMPSAFANRLRPRLQRVERLRHDGSWFKFNFLLSN